MHLRAINNNTFFHRENYFKIFQTFHLIPNISEDDFYLIEI